jgi:sugar-specific transcriptional regulator TrmB
METIEELKELDLDENEIKVYLSCLNKDGSNVKEISKKSNLIRTSVYGILQNLTKKSLISAIKKEGITFFQSVPPKELINILEEKKQKIKAILPKLEELGKYQESTYNIEFFEGKEAVKRITNDIISMKNEIVKILGAGKKWFEFSEVFSIIYYRKKKEMNVKTKTILSDTKEEREFIKNKDIKNSEFKFIKDMDITKTAIFIYQDKVAFVSYEGEIRGFIIKDKEFNQTQNILFDNQWRTAK